MTPLLQHDCAVSTAELLMRWSRLNVPSALTMNSKVTCSDCLVLMPCISLRWWQLAFCNYVRVALKASLAQKL